MRHQTINIDNSWLLLECLSTNSTTISCLFAKSPVATTRVLRKARKSLSLTQCWRPIPAVRDRQIQVARRM